MKNLYTSLLEARRSKGLSQTELSQLLSLPQSYISEVEQGKHDIKTNTLLNWARVLDLELMLIPRQQVTTISYFVNSDKSSKRELPAAYGPLANEVQ